MNIALPQLNITLAAAEVAISAALEEARRNGWLISVAVVDASGLLVAFARDDNAIAISPTVAMEKAKTAAYLKDPSKKFEDFINEHQKVSFLSTPGATALEGGVPIYYDDQVIGAVGVSGAHGPNDSQVAQYAADSLAKQ